MFVFVWDKQRLWKERLRKRHLQFGKARVWSFDPQSLLFHFSLSSIDLFTSSVHLDLGPFKLSIETETNPLSCLGLAF